MKLTNKLGIPEVVFWDFDGVIKESIDVKTNAFLELFAFSDSEVLDKIRCHHEANGGMSRFIKIPLYLEFAGEAVTEARVMEMCELFGELVFNNVVESNWVIGAKEYLTENKHKQKFYLISATPINELLKIVEKLDIKKCFNSIYGAPVSKNDAIKFVLQNENISPSRTVMIGDAIADFEAALSNGVHFILRKHSSNQSIFTFFNGDIIDDISEL